MLGLCGVLWDYVFDGCWRVGAIQVLQVLGADCGFVGLGVPMCAVWPAVNAFWILWIIAAFPGFDLDLGFWVSDFWVW